jgi:acetyl esterase
MALHPQAQAIISGVESMGLPPFETLSIEEQRGFIQQFGMFMIPREEVASTEDFEIPGPEDAIPVRVYLPAGEDEGPYPAVMYFHGGGWSTGDVELVDPICRALANRSGSAVVSVDYRLAPEHPYPAAVMDAYVATAWIGAYGANLGIDASRMALVGDSSGANLATVTCMLIRDKADDIPIAVQILLCPVTDLVKFETPSHKEYGEGHLLTTAMMEKFREYYLTGVEDRVDEPYCSPVRTQNLQDLPPVIIITAECDPLRDEAEAYGQILRANGNLVEVRREEGMVHNFFWMGAAIDRGREIIDQVGADLRAVLHIPR